MLTFLYQAIIQPLVYMTELVYMILDWIFKGNAGISITGVSVIISLLSLPLYIKAEEAQRSERAIQDKMRKRVTSIKKHFSGDERFMMLSTYYRQNGYHPLYALRSSVGLLVQVPFFIAAYQFLSGLEALDGQAFLGIRDLGSSDGLLTVAGLRINLLPILMTAINVVSGFIYTRGFPLKEKIQLNAIALVFLALLYNSPSALVLYWTLNNLFSLVKNVFLKLRNPAKALYIVLCCFLAAFCFYVFFVRHHSRSYRLRNYGLTLLVTALLAAIPLYLHIMRSAGSRWFSGLLSGGRWRITVFALQAVVLFALLGIYVPLTVVASSPFEFSFLGSTDSPFALLLYPFAQAFGLLVLWPLFLYALFSDRVRSLLVIGSAVLLVVALVNVFVFPVASGEISRTLQFTDGAHFSRTAAQAALCLVVIASVTALYLVLVSRGMHHLLVPVFVILIAGLVGFSGVRAAAIEKGYRTLAAIRERDSSTADSLFKPVISMSREGRNVVVIMLDKAIGAYLPLILEEWPQLANDLDGFVFYPNTLSFGQKTIIGAPPLFGGYEYTPEGMNARSAIPMVEKHNESLLVMPELFRQAGYSVLVSDAPFVNYDWVADPGFFRSRGFKSENLKGKYTSQYLEEYLPDLAVSGPDQIVRRNMLFFSILTAAPSFLKGGIYNDGSYWNSSLLSLEIKALDSYAVLHYLDRITDAGAAGNTFTMMVNDLPHDPALLSWPDYEFGVGITDPGTDVLGESNDYDKYHCNAASVIMLARWLDHLRELGVYDNSRIIISSDHGSNTDHPHLDEFGRDVFARYNPLLLIKDFSGKGPLRTDTAFMTNADVPTLALDSILESPRNPFTGTAIDAAAKERGIVIPIDVTIHQGFSPDLKTATTCFNHGARVYRVTGDEDGVVAWEKTVAD